MHVSQKPKRFKELPKRHRDFVKAFVRTGDVKAAYLDAGYKNSTSTMNKARKLHDSLARYIQEELKNYVKSVELGVVGLSIVRDIAENSDSDAVRLNAAKEMMNRALPEEPKEVLHKHEHEHKDMTTPALEQRIRDLQDKLGFFDAKDVTPHVTTPEPVLIEHDG